MSNTGRIGVKAHTLHQRHGPASLMDSGPPGRWDRNRTCNLRCWRPNPACRVVSDAIATCRSAPCSLSSYASDCYRVSAVTGADTGATSACAGALLPALEYPTRGRTHLPDGLIA